MTKVQKYDSKYSFKNKVNKSSNSKKKNIDFNQDDYDAVEGYINAIIYDHIIWDLVMHKIIKPQLSTELN